MIDTDVIVVGCGPAGSNCAWKLKQDKKDVVIGDAAGLATQDMDEGIGPSVESGILVAEVIILA